VKRQRHPDRGLRFLRLCQHDRQGPIGAVDDDGVRGSGVPDVEALVREDDLQLGSLGPTELVPLELRELDQQLVESDGLDPQSTPLEVVPARHRRQLGRRPMGPPPRVSLESHTPSRQERPHLRICHIPSRLRSSWMRWRSRCLRVQSC
jgi:hypothetical protein